MHMGDADGVLGYCTCVLAVVALACVSFLVHPQDDGVMGHRGQK